MLGEKVMNELVIAKKLNNQLVPLSYPVRKGDKVEFISLTSRSGMRIYEQSLTLVLIRAVKELFPGARLIVQHSLSRALYCEIGAIRKIDQRDVQKIETRMKEIVARDEPFKDSSLPINKTVHLFHKHKQHDKVQLLKYCNLKRINTFTCGETLDCFYGPLAPSTGYLKTFELKYYAPGFVLRYPLIYRPDRLPKFQKQKKLFQIFQEHETWAKILGVENVAMLNEIIEQNEVSKFIKVSEALHEKKIGQIADQITQNKKKIKLVFIAGPSASGKTTFSKRLSIQLLVNEIRSYAISIDSYFVERRLTPRDEYGKYDYETIKAIDVDLLALHIKRLLAGKEVDIPEFSFHAGKRRKGPALKLTPETVLIIEGIHGLNEALLVEIPRAIKFKIYINSLTHLNLDDHRRISTTDSRMIRRIVRDCFFRGYTAQETIKRWYQIRRGEEQNIYPFQEDADAMFNSALVYELAVLKNYASTILKKIKQTSSEYDEACRILNLLEYFLPVSPKEVPPTSILREFIGGSSFLY